MRRLGLPEDDDANVSDEESTDVEELELREDDDTNVSGVEAADVESRGLGQHDDANVGEEEAVNGGRLVLREDDDANVSEVEPADERCISNNSAAAPAATGLPEEIDGRIDPKSDCIRSAEAAGK